MKKLTIFSIALLLVSGASVALAKQGGVPAAPHTLELPEAAAHSNVISLGSAVDPQTGKVVDGIAIIHHAKDFAKGGKPGKPGSGSGGEDPVTQCYSYLAGGASWKSAENYILDPRNTRGIPSTTVAALVAQGLGVWEAGASNSGIFGTQTGGAVDGIGADGKNEFMFGDISTAGVIGVTYVWYERAGNPKNRALVEWDMMLDDKDFDWSTTGEAGKMDFLNIFVHEAGHALGLSHAEDASCSEETMYPTADYGETKKRDLEAGDLAGVRSLY